MSNITQTKSTVTEYIPNEGPALYSDIGTFNARVDQDLAAIKDNRAYWEKIDKKPSNSRLIKFGAAVASAAALGVAAGVEAVNSKGHPDQPNHPDAVRIENADGKLGAVKFIPWENATAAQKHSALVESGAIQQEP